MFAMLTDQPQPASVSVDKNEAQQINEPCIAVLRGSDWLVGFRGEKRDDDSYLFEKLERVYA